MFKSLTRGRLRRCASISGMAVAAALMLVASGCAGGHLSSASSDTNDRETSASTSALQSDAIKNQSTKSTRSKRTAAKASGGVPKTLPMSAAMADYRQILARHIRAASADQAFEGVPPNPLYAIVVLSWQVDAEGKVSNLRVLRSAAHAPTTDKLALESVRRAHILPKPSATVLRQGGGGKRLTVLESWLFKDANHFQLRTLALNQASE